MKPKHPFRETVMADQAEIRAPASSVTKVIACLEAEFGERLSKAAAVLERFGKDESFHASVPPDAVVTPHSTEEVSRVVSLCAEHRVQSMIGRFPVENSTLVSRRLAAR